MQVQPHRFTPVTSICQVSRSCFYICHCVCSFPSLPLWTDSFIYAFISSHRFASAQEAGFDMSHPLDSNLYIQPLTFFSIPSFHHVNRITFLSSLGMLCVHSLRACGCFVQSYRPNKTSHPPCPSLGIGSGVLALTPGLFVCLLSAGMASHPPIPVMELADHIERLKANDNLKFSQEYEVMVGHFTTYCLKKDGFAPPTHIFEGAPRYFWYSIYKLSTHLFLIDK